MNVREISDRTENQQCKFNKAKSCFTEKMTGYILQNCHLDLNKTTTKKFKKIKKNM